MEAKLVESMFSGSMFFDLSNALCFQQMAQDHIVSQVCRVHYSRDVGFTAKSESYVEEET